MSSITRIHTVPTKHCATSLSCLARIVAQCIGVVSLACQGKTKSMRKSAGCLISRWARTWAQKEGGQAIENGHYEGINAHLISSIEYKQSYNRCSVA